MKALLILSTGFAVVLTCASVHSAVIVEHVGNTDPSTEGFVLAGFSEGPGAGVVEDGEPAWMWDDQTGFGRFQAAVFASNPQLNANGWIAEARMKFGGNPEPSDVNVNIIMPRNIINVADLDVDNTGIYNFHSLNGNPLKFRIAAAPSPGFHDYKIVYDPTNDPGSGGTYTYYMDNALIDTVNSNDLRHDFSVDQFGFGMNASPGTAWWSSVRLSDLQPIPEPSTAVLFGIGMMVAVCRQSRKGRKM